MNLPLWKKMLVALCVIGGGYGLVAAPALHAQKADAKTEAKSTAPEAKKPLRRLPNFFGDIVDGTQKEKIYGIQDTYNKQIEVLADQIKALQQKRDGEIEALLSAEQKAKLEKARADAKTKAAERAAAKKAAADKATAAATTTTTAKPAK